MNHAFIALVVASGFAASADAVGLTMTTDQSVYNVGENIVLSIVGDTSGGAAALTVFVDVVYGNPGIVNGLGAAATQSAAITSFGGALPWAAANPACTAGGCTVMNQLAGTMPLPPDPAIIIGTLTIPVIAVGVLEISVANATWFGASAPAPVVITVPEPTTAALLVLGLVSLGVAARVRG
jgi:hypothetical protein